MRWRILGLLFLARIGLGFQFQTLASVGDDLVIAYGIGYAEIGFLIGLFMAPGLFLALPAGLMGNRYSDRVLAAAGLAALAIGGLVSAMAGDTLTIGFGRVLAGVGFLFSTLYFTKMIADWFSGREIATAMSVLVMSWPFGIAMGQVGHEWLAASWDWRAPFLAASVYCLLAALGVLAFYRPASERTGNSARSEVRLSGTEWRLVLIAGGAWGVFNAGYVLYLTYGPLMLEAMGRDAFDAAAIISIGSWIMIASGALCGQIADRTGRRNLVLVFCGIGAVAALLLLGRQDAGIAASILFGLVGMAPAGVIMALAGEAVRPERRALGMGVFFTIYYAVMAASPPVAGWIYDLSGNAFHPIVFAMALFAAVVPAALLFARIKTGEQSGKTGSAGSATSRGQRPDIRPDQFQERTLS